jgi:hypothetical protein
MSSYWNYRECADHEQVCGGTPDEAETTFCTSGRHVWLDPEDRRRCCNGYRRVQHVAREYLEAIGAENIVLRQLWRGWKKD